MSVDFSNRLISTEWLARHLGETDLRILDASWYLPDQNRDGRREYESGHIPGAQFIDLDAFSAPDTPLPHMAPTAAAFSEAVGALGIANQNKIVVYDGAGCFSAARIWLLFRLFGHHQVAVLDGGLPKWTQEGRSLTKETADFAATIFTATLRPGVLLNLATVKDISDTGAAQLVDARAPARFAGAEPEPRAGVEPGHIPGSVNLHYDRLLDPETRAFLAPEEIQALCTEAGIKLTEPIVTTCGSGVTAAILLLAFEQAGARDVRLYDGSWSEWGSHPETIKARGL